MDLSNLSPNEIVFPNLGIDITIDKTAFSIFGLDVQWYGVIIAVAILLAITFGLSQTKKYGLNSDRVIDCVIGGVIGGIVGARLYYVIFSWEQYSQDWKSIFNIREGGLAIYGGIIGSLLVALIIAKVRKVKVLPLLDIVGMSFLIGQGIGRWGNFTNQEAFGTNTDLPWGMSGGTIQSRILTMIENGNTSLTTKELVHPCFLYESVWCLVGFLIIYLYSKHRKFDGQLFLMYLGWYGLGRAFIEGLRTDSLMLGNIKVSQVLAVLLVVTSIVLLLVFASKVKRMGVEYVFYKDTEESKQLMAELTAPKSKKSKEENTKETED
jgi:phosphatidylglycerol:prolipoprotein diacylglycerol transferase